MIIILQIIGKKAKNKRKNIKRNKKVIETKIEAKVEVNKKEKLHKKEDIKMMIKHQKLESFNKKLFVRLQP
jgi:hypothetical protein